MSHPEWGPWDSPIAADDDGADDEDLYISNPITYERDDTPLTVPDATRAARPQPAMPTWTPRPPEPPTRVDVAPLRMDIPPPAPPRPPFRPVSQDPSWPPRLPPKRRPPRWALAAAAAIIVAAGGRTAFALAGSPGAPSSSGLTPPVTPAAARDILARYTAANNTANARMDPGLLASIETGSSQAIDSAAYLVQRAEGASPSPAFAPATSRFWIPREPAAYPRWFAVSVANRELGARHAVLGTGYLLFTRASAGAPWKVASGPFLTGGPAAGASPALDSGGHAAAVTAAARGLAVPESRIAAETAESVDGHGPVQVPDPGSLADVRAVTSQRPGLPRGSTVSDTRAPAGYPVAGLRTAGGGALVFCTDAATVTYQAPPGRSFTMDIPGLYDRGQRLGSAGLRVLDQFAVYDPPAGHGAPRVVAAFSGIGGKR
ncbi:MAG: hypothetical protein FWE35_26680 [Streptosporangiales bacterium]|nr:hypothetical protein [Streptosporangiales bacterium]